MPMYPRDMTEEDVLKGVARLRDKPSDMRPAPTLEGLQAIAGPAPAPEPMPIPYASSSPARRDLATEILAAAPQAPVAPAEPIPPMLERPEGIPAPLQRPVETVPAALERPPEVRAPRTAEGLVLEKFDGSISKYNKWWHSLPKAMKPRNWEHALGMVSSPEALGVPKAAAPKAAPAPAAEEFVGPPAAPGGIAQGELEQLKTDEGGFELQSASTPRIDGKGKAAVTLEDGTRAFYAYKDTEGLATIGHGFNLKKAGAATSLTNAGILKNIKALESGDEHLTAEEAERLLASELPHYEKLAERWVGKDTWDKLTPDRQQIIFNMAFNMGGNAFTITSLPRLLKKAVNSGRQEDYDAAADRMLGYKWAAQVKGRAVRLAERMRGGPKDDGYKRS